MKAKREVQPMALPSRGARRAKSQRKFLIVSDVTAATTGRVVGSKLSVRASAEPSKLTSDRTKVLAAQLRRDVDVKTGRKTPEWIAKLANKGDLSQMAK